MNQSSKAYPRWRGERAQARGYGQALARLEAERLRAEAIAVRAGMADEKGWKAWLKGLGDD